MAKELKGLTKCAIIITPDLTCGSLLSCWSNGLLQGGRESSWEVMVQTQRLVKTAMTRASMAPTVQNRCSTASLMASHGSRLHRPINRRVHKHAVSAAPVRLFKLGWQHDTHVSTVYRYAQHVCRHVHAHVCTHFCTHAYTHVHTHAYAHAYTHANTHDLIRGILSDGLACLHTCL